VNKRLKRNIQFSLLTLPVFLLAGILILRLMSSHRIKTPPTRLTYSIYCVNSKYLISTRTLDELHLTRGTQPCKVDDHDYLSAAEDGVNDLGGVGSTCSCDQKLYVYCVNGRVRVNKLPPDEMNQEPGNNGDICEQTDDALTEKGNPELSCECPKLPATGKQGETQGGVWRFFGFAVLILVVSFLIFLRLRQPDENSVNIL
jgi:hypothetical protein